MDQLTRLKAAALDRALTTAPARGKRNQTMRAIYLGTVRREYVAAIVADGTADTVGAHVRRVQEVHRGKRRCSPRAALLRDELRRLGDEFPESRTAIRDIVLSLK